MHCNIKRLLVLLCRHVSRHAGASVAFGHCALHKVEIMADASELVLGTGKRCRTDAKIIRYPDRFEDEQRGAVMFATIMKLLQEAEAAQ